MSAYPGRPEVYVVREVAVVETLTDVVEVTTEEAVAVIQTESGGSVVVMPNDRVEVLSVAERGPAGPTGPAGAGAGADHTWAFGDAPQVVHTATQSQRLVAVTLAVRTQLNGVVPSIRLGKTGTGSPPADVLAGGDTDPKAAGLYDFELDYPLAEGESLTFTITPDGSTAGNGVLTLYFV